MNEVREPARFTEREVEPPSLGERVALAVLCAASLVLTTTVNRAAGVVLGVLAPGPFAAAAPETCIASCAVALLIYVLVRPRRPFARPVATTDWPFLRRLGIRWMLAWLAASAANALLRGGWHAYAHGAAPLAGFLVFGPLGEEFLFRGAIFEMSERVFPARRDAPLVLSTLCFSAHHLQLHGYRLDAAAVTQMGFTLPMGWIFAVFRRESRSLWPGLLLHVLTNLPGAFGR